MQRQDEDYTDLYTHFKDLFYDLSNPFSKTIDEVGSNLLDRQISGVLLPVVEIVVEVRDLFIPYEEPSDILNDILRPVWGIINVAQGLIKIALAPLVLAISLVLNVGRVLFFNLPRMLLYYAGFIDHLSFFSLFEGRRFVESAIVTISGALEGITTVLRGVTQIVEAPIAWIKAVSLGTAMAIKTYKKSEEDQSIKNIEEDPSIKENINKLRPLLDNTKLKSNTLDKTSQETLCSLHYEFQTKIRSGRKTNIRFFNDDQAHSRNEVISKEEATFYKIFDSKNTNEINKEKLIEYIQSFTQSSKGPQ